MKNGWTTKSLADVAEISAGNSAPQAESLFKDGIYPFFRTADAGRIRFGEILESNDYLNEKGVKGLRRFPKGTILFPKSGASTFLNHRVILGVEGCVSSHLATILADENQAIPRFLLYFLVTVEAQDLVQDHAYPSLNLPTIAGISVQVPPLPEQRRIVGILDEAFEGIATAKANAEKNLENTRSLFESHLESVFTQRGQGWLEKRLGNVCSIGDGNYSSKYPKASEFVQSGIPFLTATNLKDGTVMPEELRYISPEQHSQLSKGHVKTGDLVIVVRGSKTGNSSIVPHLFDGANLNSQLAFLRPSANITNKYLFYSFNSRPIQEKVRREISGAAQPQLPNNKLLDISICYPPLDEQHSIVAKLDSLREETRHLKLLYQQKLAALDALKKSLLSQAFNGKL
jgi:type I restriction enzyme S subunit